MKDSFVINKVKFTIESYNENLYQEQKKEVNKFITRKESEHIDEVTISYTKERSLFELLKKEFELSNDIKQLPTFKGEFHYSFNNGNSEVYLKDNGEYFAFRIHDNKIIIVGNPDLDTHEFPFRIIREVLVRKMEDRGYAFTHATGFKVNGKGYCVIANSGGGKTTLMIKMLEHTSDSKLISNDRVFLKKENDVLKMCAFPIPIVFAMGTVKGSRKLTEKFTKDKLTEHYFGISLDEVDFSKKMEFNLTDIENVFDCSLSKEETVNAIIIPKINHELKGDIVKAHLICPSDAEKTLRANCFTPIDSESEREPWIYQRLSSINQLQKVQENIIEAQKNVPIIYTEYSLDASPENMLKSLEETLNSKDDKYLGE